MEIIGERPIGEWYRSSLAVENFQIRTVLE